jgi:hypothetical protein
MKKFYPLSLALSLCAAAAVVPVRAASAAARISETISELLHPRPPAADW